jgi:putative two-component system response regulator
MVIGKAVVDAKRVNSTNEERKPVHPETASTPGTADWSAVASEPARRTVLVVDDRDSNVRQLRELLEEDGCRVVHARYGAEALEMLGKVPLDLIVLDRFLADMDGAEFCRRVRANHRTEMMPLFMLSGAHAVEHEVAAIGSGANAFLTRPFHPEVFSARVRSMLRHKAMVDRLEESEAILLALSQAVELRDPNTAGHCDRLAALGVAMGIAMGLPTSNLLALHRGGYLHDIGKIGMPDSVLFKKGPLNEEDWVMMRTHTIKGEAICQPVKGLGPVLPIIRSHHERWDGSGYPDGLAGRNIPLLARVLQFADIYDALTATRCYKAAMSPSDALGVMREETERGWHDPELMRIFLGIRHDAVREASESHAQGWEDLQVMQESLENLQASILHF